MITEIAEDAELGWSKSLRQKEKKIRRMVELGKQMLPRAFHSLLQRETHTTLVAKLVCCALSCLMGQSYWNMIFCDSGPVARASLLRGHVICINSKLIIFFFYSTVCIWWEFPGQGASSSMPPLYCW